MIFKLFNIRRIQPSKRSLWATLYVPGSGALLVIISSLSFCLFILSGIEAEVYIVGRCAIVGSSCHAGATNSPVEAALDSVMPPVVVDRLTVVGGEPQEYNGVLLPVPSRACSGHCTTIGTRHIAHPVYCIPNSD